MNATFVAPEDFDLARLTTSLGAGLVVFTSDRSREQYYGLLEPGTYGIAVADVTHAREHGPATSHPAFGKNAIEFLDGLDASDGFVVEDRAESSLGALAAWSSRVSTEGEEWTHIDVERPAGGAVPSLSFLNPSVIFVADIADAIVLVQVWADTPETLSSWLPRAMVVVNSIEFDYTPCC